MIDPFRLIPSACRIDKPFISNGKFKITGGDESCFIDGKLEFARGDEKPDGCYKTYVTPCCLHSGVVYQSDDIGLEMAFNYRLGCVREPSIPGYHKFLMRKQNQFFRTDTQFLCFIEGFKCFLRTWFERFGEMDAELKEYAYRKHQKRKMRIRAYLNIVESGDLFHKTFNRRVTGKVKRAEIAKPGKATRLINDLTCEGSLLCGFVADQIKQAMAAYTSQKFFQFIKSPNLVLLKSTFDKLMDPEGPMFFPFFSDDSCVSIRCEDGLFMANVDISSCDGSHGKTVFDLLRQVTSCDSRLFRYVDGAIKQCEMPLTLTSAATKQRVVLKPNAPTLYSGSTLTTLINNFANIAIAHSISARLHDGVRKCDCEELIRVAAEAAGYIVTVQVCDTYHDLQFLKHSPCVTASGQVVPVLNLGVILRSLGCCWGDLPTYRKIFHRKLSFEERAHYYNLSQVQCYKNCATHPVLEQLRTRYSDPIRIEHDKESYLVSSIEGDFSRHVVSASEIAIRYRITAEDVMELAESMHRNVMINTVASRSMLSLDYGL